MNFSMMQQRRAIRRAIEIPCTLYRASDRKILGTRGLDLSEQGMLVGANEEMRPGDDVIVSFTFTPYVLPFRVEGKVARFLGGRRQRDRMPAAAIRFDSIDAVSRLILRGSLRRIPPVLPARARRIDYAATISKLLAESRVGSD